MASRSSASAASGIRDILIANQIVGAQKVKRLIYLENPWAGGRIGYKNGYEVFPESGAADTAQEYFQKISGRNKEKRPRI